MRRKKSLLFVLTRILYMCGFLFLVSGLILTHVDASAFAAGSLLSGARNAVPHSQDSNTQTANDASSLVFSSGCNCSCSNVNATICNVGEGDMKESVPWSLYYSPDSNPILGTVVDGGELGPLKAGECANLYFNPTQAGNFAYALEQEPGAIGPSTIWSASCMVEGACFAATPTATATTPASIPATSTAAATSTSTQVPTSVATATTTATPPAAVISPTSSSSPTNTPKPLDYNLSAICGYPGDQSLLWKVANHTDQDSSYTWRVSGSDEMGKGTVPAGGVDYFTTSPGEKTVRLFVNNKLADSCTSKPPCKQELTLSYTCTAAGKSWYAQNPNSFGVDYRWELDGQAGGKGVLPAGGNVLLTRTDNDVHTVLLTWTDTRPGAHVVSLASSPGDCLVASTETPPVNTATPTAPAATATATSTAPAFIITATPTATPTQGIATRVLPTITSTQSIATRVLPTITPTATPKVIVVTATPPPPTLTPLVNIVSATPSNTAPALITWTPSWTPTISPSAPTPTLITPETATPLPYIQVTPIPTQLVTLPPPLVVVTGTPVLVPITGADLTGLSASVGKSQLALFGGLLTNTGLFVLGLALVLTGMNHIRRR